MEVGRRRKHRMARPLYDFPKIKVEIKECERHWHELMV
jgi:hypothetical protein